MIDSADEELCQLCFSRPRRLLRNHIKAFNCLVCEKRIKEEKRKNDYSYMKERNKTCRVCGESFSINSNNEKDCRGCREKMSILKCNENWIKREVRKKVIHSDAVDTCFFGRKVIAPKNEYLT